MDRLLLIVGGLLIALLILSLVAVSVLAHKRKQQLELNAALRKLWYDHVAWTREYILAVHFDSPNKGEVAARLLRNQDDIGTALGKLLGNQEFGAVVAQLLKEHITIAAKMLDKDGDPNELHTQWYVNANRISGAIGQLLGDVPYWQNMMKMHLDATLQEVAAVMSDSPDHITIYDDHILADALAMADKMTEQLSGLKKSKACACSCPSCTCA